MKLVYVDESGNGGDNPNFFMVGILIDVYRFSKHNEVLTAELDKILTTPQQSVQELKSHKLINGDGVWKQIPADERKAWIQKFCKFAMDCSKIYAVAINFSKFKKYKRANTGLTGDCWHVAAMSLSAQIQKEMQKEDKNKGHSFLIFDDNKQAIPRLCDAIYEGNSFYDGIYGYTKKTKTKRFDQIINTAFAIKSQHASFIQCADCIAYIYRRHFELQGKSREKWKGEKAYFEPLFNELEQKRVSLGRTANSALPAPKLLCDVKPDGWKL